MKLTPQQKELQKQISELKTLILKAQEPQPEYITPAEAQKVLKCGKTTLYKFARIGIAKKFVVEGKVYYEKGQLLKAIRLNAITYG